MRHGPSCPGPAAAPCGTASRSAALRVGGLALGGGLVGLLLAVTLLRVWTVAHVDAGLHVDEAQYWAWSRALDWGYYSKPPAIAALIAASTALLGDTVLGVKALAMLCYPLTAWVLYRLAAEIAADLAPAGERVRPERAGWLAALLFIASPVAGLLGLAATTDAPLLLCWALASRALWRAWRDGRPADWLWLGVWGGLGLLSKYTMAALAVSALAVLATLPRARPGGWGAARGLALAAAVSLLLFGPHLLWNAAHGWPTWRHTAEITVGARAAPLGESLAGYLGGLAMLLGPVVAPWLVWRAMRVMRAWRAARPADGRVADAAGRVRRGQALAFAGWLAGPLLLLGLVQALHAQAEINWTAPALLAAVLAVTQRVAPERARGGQRLAPWHGVLALQVALVAGVTLAADLAHALNRPLPRRLDVWARMRGWQQAFDQLRPALLAALDTQARRHPGEPLPPVLGTDRAVLAGGAWAWREVMPVDEVPPVWVAWRDAGRLPANHFELTAPLSAAPRPRPLLIVSEHDGVPAGLRAALAAPPQLLARVQVEQTPGRSLELALWRAVMAPSPLPSSGPSSGPG